MIPTSMWGRCCVEHAKPWLSLLLACLFFAQQAVVFAAPNTSVIPRGYFNKLSVPANTGVVAFDVESSKELYSRNGDLPLKPASVLKIVTSLAALKKFGPYHRFSTEIRATGLSGTHVDTLYVKGYGNPILTQEDLWLISRKIYLRGVRSVEKLVVDDSSFINPSPRSGQRAYQAGASALSLNFNSITFEICPVSGQSKASVHHDPREVPMKYTGSISNTSKRGATFNIDQVPGSAGRFPLQYRLAGRISYKAGCQEFYRSVADPAMYLGHTLFGMLQREGISVGRSPVRGVAPEKSAIIYTAYSKPLNYVIQLLNGFSNNMIAEQLLMSLGEREDGKFDRNLALASVSQFMKERGISPEEFAIFDGSGLSHKNRLTARALALILREALTREELSVEFEASLPVDAMSGTLRKRSYPGVVRAKTGTLNGVISLAGEVQTLHGRPIGFVILQNKVSSGAKASKLEKSVIELLRKLPV